MWRHHEKTDDEEGADAHDAVLQVRGAVLQYELLQDGAV